MRLRFLKNFNLEENLHIWLVLLIGITEIFAILIETRNQNKLWNLKSEAKAFFRKMAGIDLQISNIVVLLAVIFVIVGLVFATIWFFRRASDMSEDDRLHLERAKLLWLGAVALGVLSLVGTKKEHRHGAGLNLGVSAAVTGPSGRSATLL